MTDVEIEYCVPCGHLDNAQQLQAALLEEFGLELDGVRLTTGDGGVFTVRVDGEEVFDKADEGYDRDEIVSRVRERVGATA
jgi:selenoprotein W-related protein